MRSIVLAAALLGTVAPVIASAQMSAAPVPPQLKTGLLGADDIQKLLPPTVYFKGQSAPLQLRNAAALRFADGAAMFASLVDTSGYSTAVREKYQFYLVTEFPLTINGKQLAAGAYGAGFLSDGTFVVMDIGGHDLLTGSTTTDPEMRRPRPLQMVAAGADLRLYLGRQYVTVHADHR